MKKVRIYKTKPSLSFFDPVDAARNAKQARSLFMSYPKEYKENGLIVKTGKRTDVLPYTIFVRKKRW